MLETPDTQLLKDWSPLNKKRLEDYTKMSHFKAKWKCQTCNNEWEATIANRARGSKCPNCKSINSRGNKNARWKGHGEISGRQWTRLKKYGISIEQAWEQFLNQNRRCALTGRMMTVEKATLDIEGTTFQWIDKNVQVVKRDMPNEEFVTMCKEVALYHAKEILKPPSFKEWTKTSGKSL